MVHGLDWSSPIIPLCFDNIHRHTQPSWVHKAFCCWLYLTNWIFHTEYFCWDVPDSKIWINIKALRATVCLYASSEGWGDVLLSGNTQPAHTFPQLSQANLHRKKGWNVLFSAMIYHLAFWFSYIRFEIYRHRSPKRWSRSSFTQGPAPVSPLMRVSNIFRPEISSITWLVWSVSVASRKLTACEHCPTRDVWHRLLSAGNEPLFNAVNSSMYGMQQHNYPLLYYTHLNTPDSINTHTLSPGLLPTHSGARTKALCWISSEFKYDSQLVTLWPMHTQSL